MSKRKEQENRSVIEEQEHVVIEEKPVEHPVKESREPIYLVETLIKLEEIEKYGLNQYFIRAILPNKTYTLSEAKSRIEACINGFSN